MFRRSFLVPTLLVLGTATATADPMDRTPEIRRQGSREKAAPGGLGHS
jgi:hypothetical protein